MINQSEVMHGASVEVFAGHRLSCVGVCVQIVDSPRFDWRGALLDVGRHYFSVPFIYKFLDVCAFYKINKFHWHLTEDQVHACCSPSSAGTSPRFASADAMLLRQLKQTWDCSVRERLLCRGGGLRSRRSPS